MQTKVKREYDLLGLNKQQIRILGDALTLCIDSKCCSGDDHDATVQLRNEIRALELEGGEVSTHLRQRASVVGYVPGCGVLWRDNVGNYTIISDPR